MAAQKLARKTSAASKAKAIDPAASAAPKKRTNYFREYQRMRRQNAVKNGLCIECTTQPRSADSTRCKGCGERARTSMATKRAAAAVA